MLNGSIDERSVAMESSVEEQPSILHNLEVLFSPRGSGVSEVPYLGQDDTSTGE